VISRQDVEHVARLARLALTEAESARMQEQLSGILAYIDTLRALDTTGVEPTSHAVPLVNVMRADETRPSLSPEAALANAPDRSDGFFRVPRIIED
jgi:aspartyl-tRNA(Asn)/glutamyl-tRNA(Gln) amidotransferase subunit C